MNERIKELEKQCWNAQTNHLDSGLFVELIVKDVIGLILDGEPNYNLLESITMHFGVKE